MSRPPTTPGAGEPPPEARVTPLIALLATTLWGAAGWFPWHGIIDSAWVRTAIAFTWFALPGWLMAELIAGRRLEVAPAIPLGFAVSTALASLLGLFGCIVGISFVWIVLGFTAIGGHVVHRRLLTALEGHGERRSASAWIATALGLLVLLLGARIAFDPGVGSADDLTGFARTTFFRSAPGLGFGEHVIASGERLAPRYWIAYWPMVKALLSFAANIEPLPFTTLYLPPFLGVLALLSTFALARSCRLAEPWAWLAAASQLACCAWLALDSALPGFVLWRRLTQDKVAAAAILTPVFLAGVAELVRGRERSTWLTTTLVGLALLLTHGEALGMASMFAASFALLGALSTGRWRVAFGVSALCVALCAPAIGLRFADHPMNDRIRAYSEASPSGELASGREQDRSPYYGLRFERVAHGPYALLALAGLVSLRRRRKPIEDLALATSGVLAFVIVPYTGWILGRVVTPPHLGRVPWFAPFGVAGAALLVRLASWARADERRQGWLAVGLIPVVVAVGLLPLRGSPATLARGLEPPFGWERELESWRPIDLTVLYEDLARAGEFLDELDETVLVCGDRLTNDLLPAVSTRARLFVFRAPIQTLVHGSVSHDEANLRQRDWLSVAVAARKTTPAERVAILRARGIRFVVLSEMPKWAADLIADDPGVLPVFFSGRLVVLEIRPS